MDRIGLPEAAASREEAAPDDDGQQAIVVPSADGFLDFREVLKEIEESEAAESHRRDIVARLKQLLPQRRVQAAIVGAGAVALLFAALAVRPDATNASARLNASEVGSPADPLSAAGLPAGSVGSQVKSISNGALEQRSFANAGSARNGGTSIETSSERESSSSQKASGGSLELENVTRAPIANVSTLGSDSIVRAATSLNADGGASAIQLIASGSEKKQAIPDFSETKGTRTSAKLRGELPQPVYPAYLRQVRVQGEVLVRFVVDENGRPDLSSLKVVRSPHELLTAEVRKVITRLNFDPARSEGAASKPRSEWVQMSFVFDPSGK
jgi:TonB family protein